MAWVIEKSNILIRIGDVLSFCRGLPALKSNNKEQNLGATLPFVSNCTRRRFEFGFGSVLNQFRSAAGRRCFCHYHSINDFEVKYRICWQEISGKKSSVISWKWKSERMMYNAIVFFFRGSKGVWNNEIQSWWSASCLSQYISNSAHKHGEKRRGREITTRTV